MGNVMHRGKGSFTFVENTIFFDHGLSAKAKGIYCQIRSLENNPEWVFTIKGFASLVRDGVDAVTAGIKELEASGYIIRARKRSVNGRFLKAEEATWITLDDPAMYGEVSVELKADGFAILSEFTREPAANVEVQLAPASTCETGETGENPQVETRTGKPVSGKATSGESAPINHSSDKEPDFDKQPPSCPPDGESGKEKGGEDFVAYRKGEFPNAFERLCAMSIKPVSSLRFKRDCLAAWERRVAQGFAPEHIIEAYCAYAKSYWMRNGDDATLAKNLAAGSKAREGSRPTPTSRYRPTCSTRTANHWTCRVSLRPTPTSRSSGGAWRRSAASYARPWRWAASCRRRRTCSPPARPTGTTSDSSVPAGSDTTATSR